MSDADTLMSLGITHVPVLETDEGKRLCLSDAIRYINTLFGNK